MNPITEHGYVTLLVMCWARLGFDGLGPVRMLSPAHSVGLGWAYKRYTKRYAELTKHSTLCVHLLFKIKPSVIPVHNRCLVLPSSVQSSHCVNWRLCTTVSCGCNVELLKSMMQGGEYGVHVNLQSTCVSVTATINVCNVNVSHMIRIRIYS